MTGDAQHEPADRIRRSAAVIEHVGPRSVAGRHGILTERAHEIIEQRDRQIERSDRMRQRGDDEVLVLVRRAFGVLHGDGRMQPPLPGVQLRQAIGRRRGSLVGDVVGNAGERVYGGNVGAHRRRQQLRRHRKILVMRPRQRLARRVRTRKRLGPEGHDGILVRYA